jgi:hypothetical protein
VFLEASAQLGWIEDRSTNDLNIIRPQAESPIRAAPNVTSLHFWLA